MQDCLTKFSNCSNSKLRERGGGGGGGERERERERERETHTHTHTDTQTHRHTDRHTHTHRLTETQREETALPPVKKEDHNSCTLSPKSCSTGDARQALVCLARPGWARLHKPVIVRLESIIWYWPIGRHWMLRPFI